MARSFGKKSVVVLGGYDVAAVPSLGYGAVLDPGLKDRVKYVLERADAVLPVDAGLCRDAEENLGIDVNGFRVLPTGYDPGMFHPAGEKDGSVLTISAGSSWSRARVKGLDLFVEAAADLPRLDFILVGPTGEALDRLKSNASRNVQFHPPVPYESTVSYYQRAKVYAQLSYREGLPNAVCESMLCECVAIGSDVPGVRSAIGEEGLLVPYGNVPEIVTAIEKALGMDGARGRVRIQNLFSMDKRKNGLKEVLDGL